MNNSGFTTDFEVRKATLTKLGGDASKPTNIFECDLAILEKTGQGGGGGATIDDTVTSLTKTWSSSKINGDITALSASTVGAIATAKSEAISAAEVASSAYTDEQITALSASTVTALGGKQDTLVSGTNIKTVNSQSLLGSGDIVIQGGGDTDAIEGIIAEAIYKSRLKDTNTTKFNNGGIDVRGITYDSGSDVISINNLLKSRRISIGNDGLDFNNRNNACIIGSYLSLSQDNSLMVGKFGTAEADALLTVSNGSGYSTRLNVFSVKNDGNTIQAGSSKATEFINTSNEKAIVGTDTTIQLKMWVGTEAQYEALATKDNNTVYIIKEE